jgi:hypothetical protein
MSRRRRKSSIYIGVALFFALVGVVANADARAFFVTTIPVRVIGPFYQSQSAFDSATGGAIGGEVKTYLAADTCRIGQLVAMTSARNVKPSATIADYNAIEGVVIGGTRTNMQASIALADTTTLAATVGQRVIVLKRGRYWVLDSAGAIGPGIQVRPSGTIGRMAARTTAVDTFNRIFGRTVDTVLAGKATLIDIIVK